MAHLRYSSNGTVLLIVVVLVVAGIVAHSTSHAFNVIAAVLHGTTGGR